MAKAGSKKRSARKTVGKPHDRASSATRREEEAYIQSLIAHGQAVRVPPGGKLPPGATHEIVEDEEGNVKAVRRRFSQI